MTIIGTSRVIRHARLVLEENLEAQVEAVSTVLADGIHVPIPRPGLRAPDSDGDYFEGDIAEEDIFRYPACKIFVVNASPDNIEPSVLTSANQLRVTFYLEVIDGRTDLLGTQASRLEAAARSVLQYTAETLATAENAAASVSTLWRNSTFPSDRPGIHRVEMDFLATVHENV